MDTAWISAPAGERLLSVRELAAYLGVRPTTIYQWRSTGASLPPAVKISPHLVRYRRCDVDAWLDAHSQAGV